MYFQCRNILRFEIKNSFKTVRLTVNDYIFKYYYLPRMNVRNPRPVDDHSSLIRHFPRTSPLHSGLKRKLAYINKYLNSKSMFSINVVFFNNNL